MTTAAIFSHLSIERLRQMKTRKVIEQIKSRRKELKLSQSEMANKLFASLKTYQNIESGITKIDIERLEQIALILKTDVSALLDTNASSPEREKELYQKIIEDKENYIAHLEESLKFYRDIIRENNLI